MTLQQSVLRLAIVLMIISWLALLSFVALLGANWLFGTELNPRPAMMVMVSSLVIRLPLQFMLQRMTPSPTERELP